MTLWEGPKPNAEYSLGLYPQVCKNPVLTCEVAHALNSTLTLVTLLWYIPSPLTQSAKLAWLADSLQYQFNQKQLTSLPTVRFSLAIKQLLWKMAKRRPGQTGKHRAPVHMLQRKAINQKQGNLAKMTHQPQLTQLTVCMLAWTSQSPSFDHQSLVDPRCCWERTL